jgi:hypothetical protein
VQEPACYPLHASSSNQPAAVDHHPCMSVAHHSLMHAPYPS